LGATSGAPILGSSYSACNWMTRHFLLHSNQVSVHCGQARRSFKRTTALSHLVIASQWISYLARNACVVIRYDKLRRLTSLTSRPAINTLHRSNMDTHTRSSCAGQAATEQTVPKQQLQVLSGCTAVVSVRSRESHTRCNTAGGTVSRGSWSRQS